LPALIVIALATAVGAIGGSSASASSATEAAKVGPKKIGYIDVYAGASIEKRFFNAFKQGANHIGWTVQLQDAVGVPSNALTAMRTLVNGGVDAIVTSSIPAEWIRPAAAEAKRKKIPLINLITPATPGVFDGDIDENEVPFSVALANKVIRDFPNGAQIGVVYEGVIQAEVIRLRAIKRVFANSKIKIVATHDQPQTDAPGTAKTVTDMLNAKPGIAAFVLLSSIQPQYALAGLRTAGNKKAKVYGYYADSVNAALLASNKQFAAVVDSDIVKASYIGIGELLKKFSGGSIKARQLVDAKPVIITRSNLTPRLAKNEGPVAYSKIAPAFYRLWKSKYSVGP
jgi:ABC-type sugar transport system substrate-binding protein